METAMKITKTNALEIARAIGWQLSGGKVIMVDSDLTYIDVEINNHHERAIVGDTIVMKEDGSLKIEREHADNRPSNMKPYNLIRDERKYGF